MIILTGASGLLGREVLGRLLDARERNARAGRILILDHPRAHLSRRLLRRPDIRFLPVDLSKPGEPSSALDRYFTAEPGATVEAVIHLAAVIPPAADRSPQTARLVNTVASENLVHWLEERRRGSGDGLVPVESTEPPFIYASSISVYGDRRGTADIRTTDELRASPDDGYAETKIESERLIRTSGLNWRILRFSYLVSGDKLNPDPLMFRMPLDTTLEVCHVRDAAAAVVNARAEGLRGKLFNIAGGQYCRTSYREYLREMFNIFGLAPATIPEALFDTGPFHCGAMDTGESQELLRYQETSISDYYLEVYRRKAWLRPFVYRFRMRIWKRILSGSRYFAELEEGLRSRIIMSLMKTRTSP